MRVLVVTNMYPTADEPGFGAFVFEQVEALRRLGIEVDVLSFEGRRDRTAYLRAVARLRKQARRGYDVVHAHYGLTGAVAMLQRRVPVVTTFHGSDVFSPRQRWVSWLVARQTVPIFVSRRAAAVVGCGNAAVVPSAVDTNRFRPEGKKTARRSLGWEEDGPIALFPASRQNSVKRVALFDEAVALVRNDMPDLRTASLEGLPRDGVRQVMNAADVTVLTSHWEGCAPVAVKESLACNTPVVSVDVGDVDVVLSGLPGCAVVEPRPEALAAAIVVATSMPGSPELRSRALAYSTDRLAAEVASIYERMAA